MLLSAVLHDQCCLQSPPSFSASACAAPFFFLESLFAKVGFHVHVSTRIVSPSQCYTRARENIWNKPLLDNIIIDSLCHYCKILIHGHFELKSSNIGSGALVIQCEVVTMAQQDTSVVPKWNEEASTLDAFEERVILLVLGTQKEECYLWGPRLLAHMDPERQPYKVVKSAVTTTQLAAKGGATLVIAALRRALGARPIQETVRLFRQLIGLRDMRRQPGESMRKWTSRFEAFIKKTGKALHQADAEIDEATFLHPLIQEILLLQCSNLSPAENAAVLATSGATTKEGGSIGNSYLYVDLAASFIAQWDDEALMCRDDSTETYASHCRCGDSDVGSLFPVERFSGTGHCGGRRVGDGTRDLRRALGGPELGRAGGSRSSGRRLDRGAPTRGHGVGRSIWLPGSSGGLRSDGVQECFVGHEKRHTNVHGGQGSSLSGKACERLLPCGRCGCFRWFSNDDAKRIATDRRQEKERALA